jgi:tetratricopeptide (TPR) repeat protein
MLLLDYWPLRRFELSTLNSQPSAILRLVREKTPFFALTAMMCVLAVVVQKRQGYLAEVESMPVGARLGNALISYCRYLGKMFWPTDLAIYYLHPGHWPLGEVLLAGGLILGVSVLVWVQRRRAPYLLVGWLWYCGTLVPMSQVVQLLSQAMADRWTYVPSLGVLILIVWGACQLTRCWRYQVLALSVAGGAAILLCLASTRQQIGYWRDSEALFRRSTEVMPNNPITRHAFGSALLEKGRFDEAILQFEETIRLRPGYAFAHRNLGAALLQKGQIDLAILQFQEAVRLNPSSAEVHYNLGVALVKKGRMDEAIRQLQEATRLEPDDADTHYNLGTAFFQQGRVGEAIHHFQEATRLRPDHAEAHNNLGTALGLNGQTDEAIRQFQEALRIKPDYADARKNLNIVLATRVQSSPPPSATNR